MPKIAIIRGPNLNQWEMQNYEPLMGQFDITAYTTTKPNFDLSKINLAIAQIPSHPEHPAYMMGLESALSDKDLIYSADTTWLFSYQAVEIKKKFGKKLICLQWENIPFAYEENEQMKILKGVVRNCADHFIAVTERAKDALVLEGISPGKITVLPMGIDIERFKPDRESKLAFRKRFGISGDEKVVLFTGRMVWGKGIYDFIYSAKMILMRHLDSPLKFVVVGKGSEGDRVRRQVKELGIEDSFIFIENYPYHEMHKMYNMADIFVLPSISTRTWKEQFGMVLIEAMSCGTPVVSTYSGSIPEVVSDAGILVQPNDPKDLSEAMVRLFKDDALRKELDIKGRGRAVKEFDSREIAKRFGAVFKSVLRSLRKGDRPSISEVTQQSFHVNVHDENQPLLSSPYNEEDGRGTDYYRQERRDVEALIPASAVRVLDVGCGEGILGKRLLEKDAQEVVGIEVNPDIGAKAKKNLSRVLYGNVEDMQLPFEEGYFDCIICADVLEHLKEPLSLLKRLKGYLSDTGTIVASIPNVRYYGVIHKRLRISLCFST